jgi:hypothetical protein
MMVAIGFRDAINSRVGFTFPKAGAYFLPIWHSPKTIATRSNQRPPSGAMPEMGV